MQWKIYVYLPNLKALLAGIFILPYAGFFLAKRPDLFLPPYSGIFPAHHFDQWNISVNRREFFIIGSVRRIYWTFSSFWVFCHLFMLLEWPWLERGNPWARAARYTVSHGKQVTEIFRYRHYLAPKMSGTISGKKPEMFRPIAVRNQLTTPYGRKVLGNLKQPI